MRHIQRQKGFTLVELAIVLTIIGLLIGGILKGRQLMQNARVTATVAQVNAIEAATIAFQDAYYAVPGDMPNADKKIPNCQNCIPLTATAGDGVIGLSNWDMRRAQAQTAVAPNSSTENETLFYWAELSQAGLIGGVAYNGDAVPGGSAIFGVHAPVTRLGGGFLIANADGTRDQPLAIVPPVGNGRTRLSGTIVVLAPSMVTDLNNLSGVQILTPNLAGQIDRKKDDGVPLTGDTQAYGFNTGSSTATGCFYTSSTPTVDGTNYIYTEAQVGKDCGMMFKING